MKKQCLLATKAGVGSVYAILFLMIVSTFTMVIILQTIVYVQLQHKDRSLHHAQLFALYHAKEMLVYYDEEQDLPFSITEETRTYETYPITFLYQDERIVVQLHSMEFCLIFQKDTKEILDLVYLT